MKDRDFVYWIQGYVEICGERPSEEQWKVIKDHVKLVFNKQTPYLQKNSGDDSGDGHVQYEFSFSDEYFGHNNQGEMLSC